MMKLLKVPNIKIMTVVKLNLKYHHMQMMTINPILVDKCLMQTQEMVCHIRVNDEF